MRSGLNLRRKGALKRLEASYESFKAAQKNKEPYTSANGHYHPFRSYADECKRMSTEIKRLKDLIK